MTGLRFNGEGSEFFKIWIVNVLLTIVTLGLYYPWAKVRTKRYFYGNTTLEHKNFEYHATGKQLFISYLIAMVLLVAYVILQNISPAASMIVLLLGMALVPWIIWRSLTFNMRVTSFANVRFQFTGHLSGAYMIYIVYPVIMVILAGILVMVMGPLSAFILLPFYIYAFAYLKKKVTEYKINGSKYGQGQFSCDLELNKLVIIVLKIAGVSIALGVAYLLIISAIMGASAAALTELFYVAQNPDIAQQNPVLLITFVAIIYGGFLLVGLVSYAYAQARFREYIYQRVKLDDKMEFYSSLQARTITWVILTNFVLLVVTLGLAMPWTQVRLARAYVENTHVKYDGSISSYANQQQNKQSAFGEELGDAFDIDAGVAL